MVNNPIPPARYRTATPGVTPHHIHNDVRVHNSNLNNERRSANEIKFNTGANTDRKTFLLLAPEATGSRPEDVVCPNNRYKVLRTPLEIWYIISDAFGFNWRGKSVGECRDLWCSFHGVCRILSVGQRNAIHHINNPNDPNLVYLANHNIQLGSALQFMNQFQAAQQAAQLAAVQAAVLAAQQAVQNAAQGAQGAQGVQGA
ncbi:hypothetical protein BJ508DRAFT_334529 [Ascobolus immersus RN42]|uniref:Uncharacterized protein n=1 Tax=Ascobolus immersus RN42 TaxID=1160509 RepID=A0A3N4HFU4_ASCIM|nr:hypothetical protein BJ508DRAFT_334529 [Ascobolus immersus RN42]